MAKISRFELEEPPRETPEDWMEVLARFEGGDLKAMLKLSHLIHCFLARYGAHALRHSWADISQDVLTSLLRAVRRRSIRDPRAVVAYIGVATRNQLVNHQRALRKVEPLESGDGLPEPTPIGVPRGEWDPDLILDAQRALETLPDRARSVLDCIYQQGRSYEETASLLGLPLGTVNRMRHEGIQALRRLLGLGK